MNTIRVLIATLLFVAVNCVHSDEYISMCEKNPFSFCERPQRFARFPENSAEVNHLCLTLTMEGQCLYDYILICKPDPPFYRQNIYQSRIINRLCDTRGFLYKTFVDNAKCMKRIVFHYDKDFCERYNLRKREENKDIVDPLYWIVTQSKRELLRCLYLTADFGCFIARVANDCGSDAKVLVQTLISKSNYIQGECSLEQFPTMDEALRLFEIEPNEDVI